MGSERKETASVADNLVAVIMAGGAGTRFWPMSTESRPKQFIPLIGNRTLLQQSYDRLAGVVPPERIIVLTAGRFVGLCREQLPDLPEQNIIGEPMRRDTAAAVALGVALCRRRFRHGVMAVLTADHYITPVERFIQTLLSAAASAEQSTGALYTIGIRPLYPATAYGYLQQGADLGSVGGIEHFRLQQFREKPDRHTAESYVASGNFYWNSGMFVWHLDAITAELDTHLPRHLELLQRAAEADGSDAFDEQLKRSFSELDPISIDYGVMEKAKDVRCAIAAFQWSDVGGWIALEQFLDAAEHNNMHRGKIHARDSHKNLVYCEDSSELVALLGVNDLIVVRSGDRTLIVDRARAEEIKELVKGLKPELR
ncbi:MAG: mannose-1-phosphate guanylyltransferase [Deltaproteobacteria bacterium]|nr:mannose-1-phosphate guanylyltransferase [Deltaproteobacteria bacterium]